MTFHVISSEYPLTLASASPRRKRLLHQVGLPFRSAPSRREEKSAHGNPSKAACLLAEKKALQVYGKIGPAWTLGADTIVAIGQEMLGKPTDAEEANRMLGLLKGRSHRVITGFCVINPVGMVAHCEAVTTRVHVKALSQKEIDGYIRTGEPFGKAGSYAIQGIGAFMIESIAGSYSNVVGLPLCALIKALVSVGALKHYPLSNNL